MTAPNKKPGAKRQPGKKNTRQNHSRLTTAQRDIHRQIAAEAEHSQTPPRLWHREEYPNLWQLVESAKAAARSRRTRGRFKFQHAGKFYSARLSNLDRITIFDRQSGDFLASSGFFVL